MQYSIWNRIAKVSCIDPLSSIECVYCDMYRVVLFVLMFLTFYRVCFILYLSIYLSIGSRMVSIQTQSLALRALRKRKPQEMQALALASSQSWLPLLRPSIPIGCLPKQALAFLADFVYATQAIAFEWKPGFSYCSDILYVPAIYVQYICTFVYVFVCFTYCMSSYLSRLGLVIVLTFLWN